MKTSGEDDLVSLPLGYPIWERFFSVAPLVVIGTREGETYDLAPKHMAMPLGHGNYFAFACTPRHSTYRNIRDSGVFTVSFPRPSQLLFASLSAAPRCGEGGSQDSLEGLPVAPSLTSDCVILSDAYAYLECELDRILDGFGEASLLIGNVVSARVREEALRTSDVEDQELIGASPILAYLHPGRYTTIRDSQAFPFPAGFER